MTEEKEDVSEKEKVQQTLMPLKQFADTHALKYGIEAMAGFFHTQEIKKQFAALETEWHKRIEAFLKKGVK